jgi:hypothetical protein
MGRNVRPRRSVESLLYEILGTVDPRMVPQREIKSLAAQFEDIAGRNYRGQLRVHFSTREIRCLVGAMVMNVPALNHVPFGDTDTSRLRTLAEPLGVEVSAVPFGARA